MASIFKRGGKKNRDGRWYIEYFDENGKRKAVSSRTSDRAAAQRIANKLEADAALRREGVIDRQLDAICDQSRRTIEAHLADFKAKMIGARRDAKHVGSTLSAIRAICKAAGFQVASDITADGVNQFAKTQTESGKSARTVQSKMVAMRSFSRWLANNHKLPRDPLAGLAKPNPKADRRRERRMLLPEEWAWLRPVTLAGPERFGMGGLERVLLYTTAIQTGLRSNELRSLTRARLFLEGKTPFITAKAGSTKNRQDARQFIQPELAAQLKAHVSTKAPQAPVFAMPDNSDVAPMLQADLEAARAEWIKAAADAGNLEEQVRRSESDFLKPVNVDGGVLDFHSLRHTCGAWLAIGGASIKAVQTVMRHSSVSLTGDTYGHLLPDEASETVARLPRMLADEPKELRATGTDDQALRLVDARGVQQFLQQSGSEREQASATEYDELPRVVLTGEDAKSLSFTDLSEGLREDAKPSESAPCRTRTYNPLIKSQMLCRLS